MPATLGPVRRPVAILAVATGSGVLAGVASAVFLALLDAVTRWRVAHPFAIWGLPLAGALLGWLFTAGPAKTAAGGMRAVLASLRAQDAPPLSWRVAPAVLLGTLLTHAVGGSAGREGTAVQMGAALSERLIARLPSPAALRPIAIRCGISAGFGSVFGTPLAGAAFSLELTGLGRRALAQLLPCLLASIIGDRVTRALGATHSRFIPAPRVAPEPIIVLKFILLGALCGLCARAFVDATRAARALLSSIPEGWLRTAVGGMLVLLATLATGSRFAGLGVPMIEQAFSASLPWWLPIGKLVVTALTVGAGFIGGEVTPLFFVGATLGSALSSPLGLPTPLSAAVAMGAVFAAAARTPLALSLMTAELVGPAVLPWSLLAALTARALSGPRGIYPTAPAPQGPSSVR
jgi:H+/Cl- antiporter ClcA